MTSDEVTEVRSWIDGLQVENNCRLGALAMLDALLERAEYDVPVPDVTERFGSVMLKWVTPSGKMTIFANHGGVSWCATDPTGEHSTLGPVEECLLSIL